jgi:hypothetical protein
MSDLSGIATLVNMAPQLAGIALMVILMRRSLPNRDERAEDREIKAKIFDYLREHDREIIRHTQAIEDHSRRIDGVEKQVRVTPHSIGV